MTKSILFTLFLIFCESNSKRYDRETPSLFVQNGNLIFVAATDKNIQFKTTPSAGVSINDIDLLTTLKGAHNATRLIENYQKSFASYVDKIDTLEQKVSDMPFRGLNGSVSTVTPLLVRRLRRITNMLLKRIVDLETSLLENDCVGNSCKNGGICQDMYKGYSCHCLDGWQGTDCSEDVNECSRFVGTDLGCQNGATCINKPGTYECICPPGYVGIHCTRRKSDCATGGQELCGHGTCVQQNNQIGYKCICDQGWTTDGTNPACIVDVNECNLNHPSCSISPKVPCINVPGSFYCGACPLGYTGNGYYCSDINECETNNGGCSITPMVTCINTQGSRTCGLCPPGYEGDGTTCSFRGVCNVNNGGCHHLAQCRDNPRISSTYVECICPPGYFGSGIGPNGCEFSSNPSKPCEPNPCVHGYCSINNITGGYTCTCKGSFTGRNCDVVMGDPCATNPCQNGGTCQKLIGTFKCLCKSGFKGILCESELRGCGGKLHESSGVLNYPPSDYETYGHRLSCAWTIETNSSKILNITFTKFDVEDSANCRSDWLQIHDGSNSAAHPLGRFCGNKLPLGGSILSTHNIIYLWFRSNAGNAKTGFKLRWNSTDPVCGATILAESHGTIESPGSPGNYPPNRDCYWRLTTAQITKRLRFQFYSLNIGNNPNCDQDYIEFTSLIYKTGEPFAKFCNSSSPSPFYSPNVGVEVHFHSDNENSYPGFQMTYTVEEGIPGCGGVYTMDEGIIQSIYLDSLSVCEYKIQQGLNFRTKLTFLNLDLRQTPGCTEEYIEVREGPTSDSPLVGRYCGTTLPGSYLSNSEIYIMSLITRDTSQWKVKYEKFCGSKFFNNTGSIQWPGITSKLDCIYQIEQPLGYVISLNIKMLTEKFIHCNGYIEIRDGDHENAPLIKKICDSGSETMISTHNHIWIQFYQPENNLVYFNINYTSTNLGCGGILRKKMDNIASPVRPEGYYPPNLKCTWMIIAPPKFVIQLTWITFHLEQSFLCSYDRIEVFDNNTELGMGGLMGKFCGSTLPPVLKSSSNIMTLVFTTDITIHMDGFLATYIFLPESTVCGGNYFTPAGVIKSPGYPNEYSSNSDCAWTITVPPGQQILLNVSDFELEQYVGCRYDWLEIRNGGSSNSPLIGKFCGDTIPKQIPSHTNKLYLHFISDPNRGGRGFRITWSSTATGCGGTLTSPTGSIISPNYPEPYNRNTDCTWKIIVSAGSRIQVIFSDIDLEQNVHCNLYYAPDYVQLFDGLSINTKSLGRFCYKENKPVVSSNNQMLVKFRADIAFQGRGFQLHYSTICNNTLRGFKGVIESPNFPNTYANDLNCWWDIIVSDRNKINITFSHFQLETTSNQNDSCVTDYLEIKYLDIINEYDDSVFTRLGKYCNDKNPGLITVNSHHAQIHFLSDKWIAGSGFRLEWQLFGCGGHLTHSSGIIKSPNYPTAYPPSIKCEWHIEVDFGYSIEIEFQQMDIEKDLCEYDWIQIYNGPDNSSTEIAKICHQVKPIVVVSTGNQMYLEFHSDYSYQGRGFIANYSTTPTKCGGRFTAPEGRIFSPNYPKNFNPNDTCYWLIEIDENHAIELNFEDVDLPLDCSTNYIKVYDGPTEAYPVLKKICENAPNDTIKSTFNEIYIEFRSETHYPTKGFLAKYNKACGSRITTQGSGTIQVDKHETFAYSNCTWTIVSTDPSRHITLTITQMQVHSYDCENTSPIQIFGGETTSSPLLKSYCEEKVPPPITSDGSAITIQLLDDKIDFFATYSVFDSQCGGSFNSAKGFFATPGYPKVYPSDMECEWTINVAAGNHISLSFIEFDLLESEKCNTDFLEIRSNNVSGPLLGTYCGKNKPLNITHVGTLWMLYKGSTPDKDAIVLAKGFYGEYELNNENELSGTQGTIASPLYPQTFTGFESFSWKITVAPRKRILLTFKEFYVESFNDDCFSANFVIYDGVNPTAPVLLSTCGITIPDPIKSSSNILYITIEYNYVRMGTKFLIDWLEINYVPSIPQPGGTNKNCGSTEVIDVSLVNIYSVTSPGYPNGYKPNLNCEWMFSTISMNHLVVDFIHLNFRPPLLYRRSYPCFDDYVGLFQRTSTDNDWKLVKKICNTDDQTRFHLTNLLKLQFVTNGFINGTGFRATVAQSCGGSMTGSTGLIYFNETTVYDSSCEWNVTVRTGRTIRVTFEMMNITHDPTKGCDNYIMLRNGKYPDSPILGNGKYCGTDLPEPLETVGNYLYVKYTGSIKIRGFKIKYQEVSVECGGEIILSSLDNSTEINSPNYPNIPPPHSECSWMIRAPSDESLRIDFEERFDLTSQSHCEAEYVEVRDGGTVLSPLLGRFCKDMPHTQFSSGNMMFVKFFTNVEDPRNGFKAKISLAYCGGTIKGSEGEIRNPSQSSKEQIRNCTWHIVGPVDHYLNIQFTELNLHMPKKNKITISEKNNVFNNVTKLDEYFGTVLPLPLTTSSNEVIINYVGTDDSKFRIKFNASQSECGGIIKGESGVITSPGYPVMNHLNRYCRWIIEVPEGRRITLNFVDFDLDEAILYDQTVAVLDGPSAFKILLAYLKPGSTKRTFESSSNKMMVLFWSYRPSLHRGFKLEYSSNKPTICSSDFSKDSGVLTQPIVKNSSYWCHWEHRNNNVFNNQTLALKINLNTNSTRRISNFNCTYSTWSIIVTNQDDTFFLASLCKPTITNYIVRIPFPVTKVTAMTKTQMNFTVAYNTYQCGGIVKDQQGFLSSPNYPNKPPQSVECAWLIKVDKEQTINITMLDMALGPDCDKSFILIYNGDGPSHPRIGKYCKSDKPNSIISQSHNLWIEYKYEAGSTGTGFKIKYEATSEGCGGIYHDRNRIIQTPNYGKGYPNNAECIWEIRSNPGYSIGLQFIDRFQIEDSDNCVNDYIEISDWQDDMWVSKGKICGRNFPTEMQSTGDKLLIVFRSNSKITASGFKAKWKWLCGGTFEAGKKPRSIVSPGYPIIYKPSLNCVYKITTKADILNINFDDFELENGISTCIYDNVTITGKYYSTYSVFEKTYCGTTKPPFIRMRGQVIITFKTDKWVNRKGFKFTYSDESCGGDINETSIIESPSIKNQLNDFRYYYSRFKCAWKITAPANQIAVLRILYLEISYICSGAGLEIFNGLKDNQANRLIKLCGNLTEPDQLIHADSGNMLVKLTTSSLRYGGFRALVYFSHGPKEGCGGTVNLTTETKYIQAPDLEDLDCTWRIIAPRDYQIQIHFTELNIPVACTKNTTSQHFCSCSYIEVRDGGGPLSELIEKLCSTSNHSPDFRKFTTSTNYGYIRFLLTGRQSNAFKATLTPILSRCGPSILNATKEIQTLTSPNYPDKYPPSTRCTWMIATQNPTDKIDLHFIDFNLTGSSASYYTYNRCDDDRLEIAEDPNSNVIREGLGPQATYTVAHRPVFLSYNNIQGQHVFCGAEESPFDYYSVGSSLTVTFRSILSQNQGRGFKLEYRTAGCNRNYTSLQGRLYSSNHKTDCVITITVPENYTISLYFQKLIISSSSECTNSGFEVRDNGPNGRVLLRTCGIRVPDPVFSYTNKLYIHIYNKNVSPSPYMLTYDVGYTSTTAGRGCGGDIYNYRGWLSSPLYPNEYRNSTTCTWKIRVPTGLYAALKFVSFDLQGSCDQTYITVTTYSSDSDASINKFCKNDRPAILRSNSKIDIVYVSSVHNGGRGWLAVFQGLMDDTGDIL